MRVALIHDWLTGMRGGEKVLGVLCELLTLAMAQREGPDEQGTALDPVHRLRVTVRPAEGQHTEIASAAGVLTLRDTVLELSGDGAVPQEQGAAR